MRILGTVGGSISRSMYSRLEILGLWFLSNLSKSQKDQKVSQAVQTECIVHLEHRSTGFPRKAKCTRADPITFCFLPAATSGRPSAPCVAAMPCPPFGLPAAWPCGAAGLFGPRDFPLGFAGGFTNPGVTSSTDIFISDLLSKLFCSPSPPAAAPAGAATAPGLEEVLVVCDVLGLAGCGWAREGRLFPAGTVPGLSDSLPLPAPFRPLRGQPEGGSGGVDATVEGVSA